jgi:hypothetical protein
VSSFRPDKSYGYGLAIDSKWGGGSAKLLWDISRPIHQWTTNELEQLRSAARMGARTYAQLYFDLRPTHRPSGLGAEAA